jgi:energy-coupling factor transporter transmembrane protein EcfT
LKNRTLDVNADQPGIRSAASVCENRLRISAGWVLLLCLFLSICAFVARTPILLAILSLADVLLLVCMSARPFFQLWREGRMFIFQTAIIVTLYLIRYGHKGALPGLMVSWQIFLAFLPGIILMSTVSQSKIIHALSRIMPVKLAFVLSMSLNFMPLLISEFKHTYEAQVLRGARILPKELMRPWNWPDFVLCLLVPVIVRTLSVSKEIAIAAQIRNFGINDQRTCWPHN